MAKRTTIKQLDAQSVRALAHPLRVRILYSLRADGPGTASTLGERLGESSGATSYHVRVLAEHGFVDEDRSRGRGRERWWRAAHDMTSWRPGQFRDDPDAQAAEEWLSGSVARRGMEWIDDWIARRPATDPAWVAVSDASDYWPVMTPEQLRALLDEVHQVILRHQNAAAEAAETAPEDAEPQARRVQLLLYAFPAGDNA